ncbi:MAG TPA: alpha/beta hydrolase, partial [Chitinophagaceae bacterium]|nr:alpha/beta hydrolase [Chitinophagaceae bacterium]
MQEIFEFGGSTIHYLDTGKGDTIVLLHGFGEDSQIWNRQIALLSQNHRLIVPDLPGSGNSSMLSTPDTIEAYAAAIEALLNHLSVNKCIILGHSMGGYITLAFAEAYPERLLGWGLIHSTAFADSEEKKLNRQRGIELMQQYGAYAFLRNTIPNLFAESFKKQKPEVLDQLIESAKAFTAEACCAYYKAMQLRPDRTQVVSGSKIPVLFVLGTEDVAAPLNDLLQQVHLPPTAYIH